VNQTRELIGLIPAAGTADRISPLPCSKEIFPIGYQTIPGLESPRPKVAAQYMLEKMNSAGAHKVFIILRKGKWDIPEYFGCGNYIGMNIAYLMMDRPYGPPYTLDQSFPFISKDTVLFGFPDILFDPHDAYSTLLKRLTESGADIVLGLFPAHNPSKMDMVELDDSGNICGLDIKPAKTRLIYTWIIAVWSPVFSCYMHRYVKGHRQKDNVDVKALRTEVYVGDVIQAALDEGIKVERVFFDDGDYLDIGTPEDLAKADAFTRRYSNQLEP
jgi:glucose-1-phosphate thymidylyltransferase